MATPDRSLSLCRAGSGRVAPEGRAAAGRGLRPPASVATKIERTSPSCGCRRAADTSPTRHGRDPLKEPWTSDTHEPRQMTGRSRAVCLSNYVAPGSCCRPPVSPNLLARTRCPRLNTDLEPATPEGALALGTASGGTPRCVLGTWCTASSMTGIEDGLRVIIQKICDVVPKQRS